MQSEDIVLKCAVAIRNGRTEKIEVDLQALFPDDMETGTYLREQKLLLSAVVRKNETALARHVLDKHGERLYAALRESEQEALSFEFLQMMIFAVCDRRLSELREEVGKMVTVFTGTLDEKRSIYFWSEWTGLLARMLRRGWKGESTWLFRILLRELLNSCGNKRRSLLLNLQQHFCLYCCWDGSDKALTAYEHLFAFYMLLIGRAAEERRSVAERKEDLQTAVRALRDLVTLASRMQMSDELEVFTRWHELLLARAGSERKQRRVKKLFQMTILYWQNTMPKSSRKQMQFLRGLTKPDVLTASDKTLLRDIS